MFVFSLRAHQLLKEKVDRTWVQLFPLQRERGRERPQTLTWPNGP